MSNVATVSFKISPDHYTVLKALAAGHDLTVSEFVRDTVTSALNLDHKAAQLTDFFSNGVRISEQAPTASR